MSQGSLFAATELVKPPDTGWRMPTSFPRLDDAKVLSIDCETCDPGISAGLGPGVRRGGFIAGIAVGTDDGHRWYFPMRHENGVNFDPDVVLRWAREELCRESQPKIGANLLYDLDFLEEEGVKVKGALMDVLLADPLLDEHQKSYSLGAVARRRVGEGKDEQMLYDWCAQAFGGKATRKAQGKNIWRAPASLVGPYAESDVDLPFKILEVQRAQLLREELMDVFTMECELIPMLLAMRRRGVRVNSQAAAKLSQVLKGRAKKDRQALNDLVGFPVNPNGNNPTLVKAFNKLGIDHPLTDKGNPSFPATFLEHNSSELCQLITSIRKWEKAEGTFVTGYVQDHAINGRIHCEFHQMKSDDGGTVSGRFSSSNPNLQNIPARDPELGPLIRGLFIPDEGEVWDSKDYSQVEYRLFLHYARGPAAEEARAMFHADPSTDFHQMVADMAGIPRKPAKTINFGLLYGMGKAALAAQMGLPVHKAEELFGRYHNKVPFARTLMNDASRRAESRGFVKTLMGRRCRFPLWEPADFEASRGVEALIREEADRVWPNQRLKRAMTYAAVNRILQGGAADVMKKAMRDIWKAGICDVMGVPGITVHDELNWSRPRTKEADEASREARHIMENCIELTVPLKVDEDVGESWAEAK